MNRHDSGFDGTFRLKDFEHNAAPFISRSNTAPSRHRKSKRNSPDVSNTQSSAADTQRPTSEKPNSTTPHKQSSTRRKSITSSSSNSTNNTRRRGHGSPPSSRRTSCTMVDPSRPARHYRIKSSQTCPTTNRDVDDVLALHFRSCSLFSNPSYQSANPGLAISGYGPSADAEFGSRPISAPHASDDSIVISPISMESEDAVAPVVVPDTTMHWMSPSTRKQQYEKIDRANSGLRGFFRKIVPKCVSGEPSDTFYENDKSDAGSIRRYRMDVSDEDEVDEKSTAALRMQRRKLERSCTQKTATKKKLWGCL
ncbi:hypothetical protein K458DRAFT_171560 [Lentithecium fluviatile CBS 122367]|uniref:Uncharacterized protein n=1 Tax=Lentithecium fluviatile CBS 122367 TaxID=1168545 RepID=A0A6G1JCC5_9PLEO|nr:hypothetical protein K458DRAFT_171560 [Lentithecium fluviatile CBS 122367]